MNHIAVIGGGSWATALIKILSENNHRKVLWWLRQEEDAQYIKQYHHNPRYLSDITTDPSIVYPTTNLFQAVSQSEVIILAVPAAFIEQSLQSLEKNIFENKIIVSAIKGMVPSRNLLVTDLILEDFHVFTEQLAVIAGPCHAEEVALERQSYLTIAASCEPTAEKIAGLLSCRYIKATPFDDMYGVEYCAIMKNIVALACGIAHGLGYGDNFQAVMVSNAIREIKTFIDAVYPQHRDLLDTAYLGDILVTAYSQFSRNRTLGNMIGRGYTVQSAQMEMNMIAEGYYAVKSVYLINEQNYKVTMPITKAAFRILYQKASARKEIGLLADIFV